MMTAFLGSFFLMGVAKAWLGNETRAYEVIFLILFLVMVGSLAAMLYPG
jgi:hypothetical protein